MKLFFEITESKSWTNKKREDLLPGEVCREMVTRANFPGQYPYAQEIYIMRVADTIPLSDRRMREQARGE